MGLRHLYRKSLNYYQKKGLVGALKRIPHKLRWTVFRKRDILYVCELTQLGLDSVSLPDNMTIVKRGSLDQIQTEEITALSAGKDAAVFREQLIERFEAGAAVWLAIYDGQVAGMIWTIAGKTIKPHYFCLTEHDVHFFNGEVLPSFRGRKTWSLLVNGILVELKKEGYVRAYLETNLANSAAIKGISKMNLHRIATARKYRVFGKNITIWNPYEEVS